MATVRNIATAPKKKEGEYDLDALLTGATAEKPKGKSTVPEVQISDTDKEKVSRLVVITKEQDSLKSELGTIKADLIETVLPLRIKAGSQSVKIPGVNGELVTMSWEYKYSKIDATMRDYLQETTGEHYQDWFTPAMEITTKDNSEPVLRELIGLIGPENFARFFKVERWIYPTRAYMEQADLILDGEQKTKLEPVVKQFAPAFKTK
jgi:hypothetical protein